MGTFSIWHILILALIALVLFGGRGKVSDLMGDFGKGINSFKKGLAEKDDPKVINAEDIEARVEREVKRIAPQVRMPGFRPGKVPPNLIRKMHGEAIRGDALQGAVQDGVQQLLTEQKIRPALQPQVELDEKYLRANAAPGEPFWG